MILALVQTTEMERATQGKERKKNGNTKIKKEHDLKTIIIYNYIYLNINQLVLYYQFVDKLSIHLR